MIKKFGSLFGAALLIAALSFAQPARALDLSLDGNIIGSCGTATASGGAATLANKCGVITSEALTSLTGSKYTLTLTNTVIAAADILLWSAEDGTNTTGIWGMTKATPAAGSAVFVLTQTTAPNFNGTVKIRYMIIKP